MNSSLSSLVHEIIFRYAFFNSNSFFTEWDFNGDGIEIFPIRYRILSIGQYPENCEMGKPPFRYLRGHQIETMVRWNPSMKSTPHMCVISLFAGTNLDIMCIHTQLRKI